MKKSKKNNIPSEEISFSMQKQYFGGKKNIAKLNEQGGFGGVGVTPEQFKSAQDKITKDELETARQKKLESEFEKKFEFYKVPSPNSFKIKNLLLPINSSVTFFTGNEDLRKIYFRSWEGTQFSNQIPKESQLPKLEPETLRSFVTPDKRWFRLNLIRKENGDWRFQWYYDTNNQPYIQSEYLDMEVPEKYEEKEEEWWEPWIGWTIALLSIAAASLIPGAQGLYVSAAIDLIGVGYALSKGDKLGAVVSTLLAFAPFLSASVKGLGRFSPEQVRRVGSKFARAETEAEVKAIYRRLSDEDKILVRGVMSNDPKELLKLIDENIWKVYEQNLKRGTWTPKDVVDAINKLITEKKLPMPEVAKWWQKNPGLTKFGIDLGTSGLILVGSYPFVVQQELEKVQKEMQKKLSQQFSAPKTLTDEELEKLKNSYWEEDKEQ